MIWLKRKVAEVVRETIDETLDKLLPGMIQRIVREKFASEPDVPLTRVGYYWAFALALRDIWPTVGPKEAATMLQDYLDDVDVGALGYEWTARTAKEQARAYAQEFGESA